MSIETLLQTLIASIDANTAALGGAKAGTAKPAAADDDEKPAKTTKPAAKTTAAKAKKPAVTREDVTAAFQEVKEKHGTDEAKALVKSLGVAKLADLEDEQFEEALKLAQEKLEEEVEGEI